MSWLLLTEGYSLTGYCLLVRNHTLFFINDLDLSVAGEYRLQSRCASPSPFSQRRKTTADHRENLSRLGDVCAVGLLHFMVHWPRTQLRVSVKHSERSRSMWEDRPWPWDRMRRRVEHCAHTRSPSTRTAGLSVANFRPRCWLWTASPDDAATK